MLMVLDNQDRQVVTHPDHNIEVPDQGAKVDMEDMVFRHHIFLDLLLKHHQFRQYSDS